MTEPVSQTQLISALMDFNSKKVPFVVKSENNQVIATWNIADAEWLKLFAKAGLKEAYDITITLDETKHEVSYNERRGSMNWQAGIPTSSFETSSFSGKRNEISRQYKFGVKPNLELGTIVDYTFKTDDIKKPLLEAVEKNGWTVKRSFLEKLLKL